MALLCPLFLTFGSISVGAWIALRFSLNIPTDVDEVIFKSLMNRISNPIAIATVFFFSVGGVALLYPTSEFSGIDLYLAIIFMYILIFLMLGLRRINQIWPGRKLSTFTQLLDALKLKDHKRAKVRARHAMAVKIYEAYAETDEEDDRREIAEHLAELVLH